MSPERAPVRAVVRTAGHGQAVTCCVCQCGELLRPVTDGSGVRCTTRHCRTWYSKADIDAALRAAEQQAQPKEAA